MARPETGIITLAPDQQLKVFTGPANYLYCYEQSGLVEVELINGNQSIETHMVGLLLNLPRKNFDTILIRNKHPGSNPVRFFFGSGDYVPNADRSVVVIDDAVPPTVALAPGSTVNLTGSSVTVESNVAGVLVPLSDVSVTSAATLIAAANINRLEITIAVKDTEANGLRIGSNAVTATKGIYIAPGQSYTVANQAAIYGIRDGAANVSVTILQSEKV